MVMFDVLLILFQVANISAISVMGISYIFTIIAKIKKSILATANIYFPIYSNQRDTIKYCYISGFVFMLMSWMLCSSSVVSDGPEPLVKVAELLLDYGFVWAIMIFVSVVAEVVCKCIKTADKSDYSIAGGIKTTIWYAVICFIFSFLIA